VSNRRSDERLVLGRHGRKRLKGDLIVLEPNLPDSWPADSYRRLSEVAEGVSCPILTHVQDLAFLDQASPLPFAVLAKGKAEPALIRRLLISAALHRRGLTSGQDPGSTTRGCNEQRPAGSNLAVGMRLHHEGDAVPTCPREAVIGDSCGPARMVSRQLLTLRLSPRSVRFGGSR
jgi:hypothetical protein